VKVAFAGVFAGQIADQVRARMQVPCDVVQGGEHEVLARLGDVDVLVSMAFTREMATAAPRLRLVQVPGAGLDRVDRGALGPGTALARSFCRLWCRA
jgi:phosphoglycerate dehydrogenase-like enzyme